MEDHPYDHLQEFIEKLAMGNLQNNASPLTEEEEQYLFSLLEDIHDARGLEIKGIWPLLSLCL